MKIEIASINSQDIEKFAAQQGITEAEFLGSNGEPSGTTGRSYYRVGDQLVATTNGDPIWEANDSAEFHQAAEEDGVKL
ncbi:MAG TPA: hypothetical protein VN517_03730 [Terriglobales bacterium]|nr:hypothetical protein [Terriglobales bacterium]